MSDFKKLKFIKEVNTWLECFEKLVLAVPAGPARDYLTGSVIPIREKIGTPWLLDHFTLLVDPSGRGEGQNRIVKMVKSADLVTLLRRIECVAEQQSIEFSARLEQQQATASFRIILAEAAKVLTAYAASCYVDEIDIASTQAYNVISVSGQQCEHFSTAAGSKLATGPPTHC